MINISSRQTKLLQIIVDEYAYTAQPISSKEIIEKYMPDVSSATIRNDMASLEKTGLLEKTHTSSGRVPSIAGYKYYEANILKPKLSNNIKNRLTKIFSQRDLSIDTVINQSIDIINQTLHLPSVVTTNQQDELLKRFDLIQIDKTNALILIVTSSGNVVKHAVRLSDNKNLEDLSVCVRIFNDRLVDTAIKDVDKKLNSIKEIIRSAVHEYEFCIRQIIEKIFSFNEVAPNTNVYGTKWLTEQPEFHNIDKLNKALSILEDTNIWKLISYNQQKTGKTMITFGSDFGDKDLAVASTNIKTAEGEHQLSIVGPTRMKYAEIKGLLDFIKEEVEKIK